jgi:hypothetical protein
MDENSLMRSENGITHTCPQLTDTSISLIITIAPSSESCRVVDVNNLWSRIHEVEKQCVKKLVRSIITVSCLVWLFFSTETIVSTVGHFTALVTREQWVRSTIDSTR